jgi:hypothetical protein
VGTWQVVSIEVPDEIQGIALQQRINASISCSGESSPLLFQHEESRVTIREGCRNFTRAVLISAIDHNGTGPILILGSGQSGKGETE